MRFETGTFGNLLLMLC